MIKNNYTKINQKEKQTCICHQERQPNILAFTQIRLGRGQIQAKSSTSRIRLVRDFTMLLPSKVLQRKENASVIVGYRLRNKKMISKDRLHLCKVNIHHMKSCRTSEVESTSKEKGFVPYWNERSREMSSKLWLPIEIDSQDLDLNLSSGLLKKTIADSWFSTTQVIPLNKNSYPTSCQSSQFSHVGFTDSGNTLIRSRKIRFYPNRSQSRILSRWFGTARFVYNKTIEYLRQPNTIANWMSIKTDIIKSLPEWASEVPYQIKSIAIQDACNAVKNAKLKFKRTGQFQEVGFRSRRSGDYNVFIPKSAVKHNGFYIKSLSDIKFTESIGEVNYDCRVVYQNGRYFLSLPEAIAIKTPDNQRRSVVAVDPGVRTFQTLYCPDSVFKFGANDFARIFRLCYRLDSIQSKSTTADGRSRNRLKKAAERIRWKIKDLIGEIHHKVALFLVKNFDVIYLPTFETSQMVTKLHSKVARSMLTWAHFRFKEFLKFKAREYSSNVVDVNESYTSKTCSSCGTIQNIGSKKILKCKHCGISIDRDINGARGIFLKNSGALKDSSIN